MKVTVFGAGYVGLVTGACLAEMGNHVVCVDVDERKIAMLRQGEVPIHEPGLDLMIRRNAAAGRLEFTTDAVSAVSHGTMHVIGVGTPPDEDGSADLRYVLAVARTIGRNMTDYKVVIDKSTVPVGTAERVRAAIGQELAARGVDTGYAVVSNPEFLKEARGSRPRSGRARTLHRRRPGARGALHAPDVWRDRARAGQVAA